ncbi:MAG: flagellar biosynthetic protein FliO, partial [Desulfobacterales bacterium]|nr:flagellar biosynthetic protein FliO [Desulfobacterales bacterium]
YHPDLLSTVLKMITALVIVLGGLFIVFYFLRRILKRDVGGSSEKLIRVLASSYIGVKKNISLIEVPGSILVLGVTSDNICLLTKIEDEEILNRFKRPEEEKRSTSFSDQLNKLSSRFKEDKGSGIDD